MGSPPRSRSSSKQWTPRACSRNVCLMWTVHRPKKRDKDNAVRPESTLEVAEVRTLGREAANVMVVGPPAAVVASRSPAVQVRGVRPRQTGWKQAPKSGGERDDLTPARSAWSCVGVAWTERIVRSKIALMHRCRERSGVRVSGARSVDLLLAKPWGPHVLTEVPGALDCVC